MSKKISALEVVKRYHERYLEYEAAFNKNPFDQDKLKDELKKLVKEEADVDSEEFQEKMIDLVIEKPQKRADVNNSALKFILFTDFYLLTEEKKLPKDIMKDYDSLSFIKDSMKTQHSIKDGEFVHNEKKEITPQMREYFKELIKQVNSL